MKIVTSPQPILSLTDASFRLGEDLVFKNTSWTFFRNQQWAVIGANGSGKSIFADALRGCLPLVEGASKGLTGEAIGHVSFEQRKQAMRDTVVQSRWNSLEDESALKVSDYLSYDRVMEVNPYEVTELHKIERPKFERRMRRAIELLEVAPFLNRLLISLSNGELQKVQLARALSCRMKMLILDEPFAGLDAAARKHLHQVLEKLMDTSLHVLLITTRVEDLPRHVTHLLCIDRCRVVASGPRAMVLALPEVQRSFLPSPTRLKAVTVRNPRSEPKVTATPRHLVEMRKVTVRYGESVVLKNIDWTIRSGESWALLGPNGSGKTTLLSLILGDNPQVYINDISVFGHPRGRGESIWEIKKRIGWFSPELHQHFEGSATCFQVVASGFHDSVGLFHSVTAAQRREALHCLSQFGLDKYANDSLCALSTGLQRMVLLVRALVKKPDLLILDEPCQGLDKDHRKVFVETVDSILRSGSITAIYVTHRPDEIPTSITRHLKLPGCNNKNCKGNGNQREA